MSYQVIARKWRPQSFHQLVGQEHIATTLLNALRKDRLPHAMLFTGTRGVGKTSSARILAKSIRCTNAKDFEPCNQCNDCIQINSGSNINVIEIDGASNNGVDAVRELRDSVGYMPASGRYKIYIIDEVHMLSTSAFNALLKTLEEPPAHIVFIFATTEVQKIPVTVLSRCQRFDFRRIPTKQISEHLLQICVSEKIDSDPEALWLLARQADGSMRDGLSLLDQSISFCGDKLTYEQIVDILGLTDRQLILGVIAAIVDSDANQMIEIVSKIRSSGANAKNFVDELIEEIRHLLIIKSAPEDKLPRLIDLPDSELQQLIAQANSLNPEDIHLLFDIVLKGASDLVKASRPLLVLEMLLMKVARLPRIFQILASPSDNSEKKKPFKLTSPKPQVEKVVTPAPLEIPKQKASACPFIHDLSLEENWNRFVAYIKSSQGILAAKLEHCVPLSLENRSLRLGIRKNQDFLREQLSQAKEKADILMLNQEVGWNLEMEIIEFLPIKGDTQNEQLSPAEWNVQQKTKAEDILRQKIEDNPLIQKTKEVFNAKITAIREKK